MRAALLFLAVALAACSGSRPSSPPPPLNPPEATAQGCSEYADPVETGEMPGELPECSGLVASVRHPGLFWAHNDSGNGFELFLISPAGEVRARFKIAGERPKDLEAITLGPCAKGAEERCLFLGDIGDNLRVRREDVLYRLPEPALDAPVPLQAEALRFTLPQTARNLEALFSDPRSGALYVISKAIGSMGEVFRIDALGSAEGGRAVRVADLGNAAAGDGMVGAADLHPEGERLLIRTYRAAYELRAPGARTVEELLGRGKLVRVPTGGQPQSEAAAYALDGRSFLIGSENPGSPIFETRCR